MRAGAIFVPQELSKQLVKLSAERTQLKKALDADAAALKANAKVIEELKATKASSGAEVEKAQAAVALAA